MNIDFTEQDVIFLYGHFKKKIKELELLKATPSCPISKKNINQDIKIYSSITDKIEKVCPQLKELGNLV